MSNSVYRVKRDTRHSGIVNKRQTVLLYAEYFKNDVWQAAGDIFPSKLHEGKYFDYVCDDHNIAMAMVFGLVDVDATRVSPIDPVPYVEGLPDDVSDGIRKKVHFMQNAQSRICHYTLRNVINYEWDKKILLYGWIPEFMFRRYNAMSELPKLWDCYVTRNHNPERGKLVTRYEMMQILHGEKPRERDVEYQVIYPFSEQSVREYCSFFLDNSLPVLESLVPRKGRTDLVRLISITQECSMYDTYKWE